MFSILKLKNGNNKNLNIFAEDGYLLAATPPTFVQHLPRQHILSCCAWDLQIVLSHIQQQKGPFELFLFPGIYYLAFSKILSSVLHQLICLMLILLWAGFWTWWYPESHPNLQLWNQDQKGLIFSIYKYLDYWGMLDIVPVLLTFQLFLIHAVIPLE